jgi:hypothetical protein
MEQEYPQRPSGAPMQLLHASSCGESFCSSTNKHCISDWLKKHRMSFSHGRQVGEHQTTNISSSINLIPHCHPCEKRLTWHVILKKAHKYSSNDRRKNKTDCPHRGWITHPRMVLQRIRAGARKWIGPLLGLVFILFLRNLKYFIFCLTSPPDKHISSHRTTTCCSQTTKKSPPSLLSNYPQATGKEIPQNPLAALPYAIIILCTKSQL